MTTYLITRKDRKMQLDVNMLSGQTFEYRDYIKQHWSGQRVAAAKAWRVDAAKVMASIEAGTHFGLRIDVDGGAAPAATGNLSPVFVNTRSGRELGEDY